MAAGLLECQCDWVLRADADDRSSPYRAERQLRHLLDHPHLAVLGCQLSEISNMNRLVALRRVPLRPQAVTRMLSWRNPINHPTVALNRQKVLLAGSYRATLGFEDWDLWLRLNRQGLVLANLPDILVTAEVGKEHLKRRHGLHMSSASLTSISLPQRASHSSMEISFVDACSTSFASSPYVCASKCNERPTPPDAI